MFIFISDLQSEETYLNGTQTWVTENLLSDLIEKQNEIAKIIGTSNQYVSKIVKSDSRIKLEQENLSYE